MEIERKWIIKGKPNLNAKTNYKILTYYLSSNEAYIRIRESIPVSKIEKPMCRYKLTIKGHGELAREEVEFVMDEDKYNRLKSLCNKKPIVKDFYEFEIDNHNVEVSLVDNSWWYMEIEFKSVDEANEYKIPKELSDVIIRDVTFDREYKMDEYWNKTRLNM